MLEKIGPYQLKKLLAAGGMGEVYLAQDTRLEREVAIKLIHRNQIGSPRARQRFKREAQILLKLEHAFIVRVYDLLKESGQECLVMEYLKGPTLRWLIEKESISLNQALLLAREIGEGLAAAHDHGIVHRDLKAENVIVEQGHVKILDFGLAKPLLVEVDAPDLSIPGERKGTPYAMSPEQVVGEEVDERSDLFSFGVLLYELVTSTRPFSDPAIQDQICSGRHVPASKKNQKVPSALSDLIDQLLEKNPDDRPQSTLEVVNRLKSIDVPDTTKGETDLTTPEIGNVVPVVLSSSGPPAWRKHLESRWAWQGGIISAVALGVWLLFSVWEPQPSRPTVAVFDFMNSTDRANIAWCGTAAAHIMTADLASEEDLRVISGDQLAMASRRLGLDSDIESRTDREEVVRHMTVDFILTGDCIQGGEDDKEVFLTVRLDDMHRGSVRWSETSKLDLDDLPTSTLALTRAMRLALELGPLSPEDEIALRKSLPQNAEASQSYSEGVQHLRRQDGGSAAILLDAARDADAESAWIWSALSMAYRLLGLDREALASAQEAWELADDLPTRERKRIEANLAEMERDWKRAIVIYEQLLLDEPDDVEIGISLVYSQLSGNRPNGALVTLENLEKLPDASSDPRLALLRSRTYFDLGDYQNQQSAAQEARELSRELGYDGLVAESLLLQAAALQVQGNRNEALALWQQAGQLTNSNELTTIRSLETMAGTLIGIDLVAAAKIYRHVLRQYEGLGHRIGYFRAALNLGSVLSRQGNREEAERLLTQARSGFTQIGLPQRAAIAVLELGSLALYRGNLKSAEELYLEAEEAFHRDDNLGNFYWALSQTNLGEVRYLQGRLDESSILHSEALDVKVAIGALSVAGYDSIRLGLIDAAQGEYPSALRQLAKAQNWANDGLSPEIELASAVVAWLQGRYAECGTFAVQAEKIALEQELNSSVARARVLRALSQLEQGNIERAVTLSRVAEAFVSDMKDLDLSFSFTIARAKIQIAASSAPQDDLEEVLDTLLQTAEQADDAGFVLAAFEARLAEAELRFKYLRESRPLEDLRDNAKALKLGSVVKRINAQLPAEPQQLPAELQ